MSMLPLPAPDAPAEEWGALAASIPGAPAAWHRTEEFILVTGDGQHIALDGTWWSPIANRAGLLSLDVDHPATAGCLLALLGVEAWRIQYTHGYNGVFYTPSEPSRDRWSEPTWIQVATLGRACIAAAAAIGRWPGGEG